MGCYSCLLLFFTNDYPPCSLCKIYIIYYFYSIYVIILYDLIFFSLYYFAYILFNNSLIACVLKSIVWVDQIPTWVNRDETRILWLIRIDTAKRSLDDALQHLLAHSHVHSNRAVWQHLHSNDYLIHFILQIWWIWCKQLYLSSPVYSSVK